MEAILSCYVRFRRQCDIRASVIDAFATFLLLSYYVKILFLSFDFCTPSHLMNKNGSIINVVSYFNASIILSPDPQPAIILSVIYISLVVLILTFLPLVLIFLYPCGFCQKYLTYCRVNFQSLHFLMNTFNRHFKDGSSDSFDCRFSAAIFLFMQILISVEYLILYFNYYACVIITCTALAVSIAAIQPYGK